MTTKTKAKTRRRPAASPFCVPAEEFWPSRIEEGNDESSAGLDSAPAEATEAAPSASPSLDGEGAPAAAPTHPKVTKPEWCLLVFPEAQYPTLVIYPSLEAMAARLRTLVGRNMAVFPFYGIPVPFTQGPYRFLCLPNGQLHPLCDLSAYGTFIANPLKQPPIDCTYYLGAEDLSDLDPPSVVVDHRPVTADANAGSEEQAKETAPVS
jgi:hypothetical protein